MHKYIYLFFSSEKYKIIYSFSRVSKNYIKYIFSTTLIQGAKETLRQQYGSQVESLERALPEEQDLVHKPELTAAAVSAKANIELFRQEQKNYEEWYFNHKKRYLIFVFQSLFFSRRTTFH